MPGQTAAIGSIARAARVIDALAALPEGAALADLVSHTGFSKTTTFRVLAALQDQNYVFQDPQNREYRLGSKLAELSRVASLTDLGALAGQSLKRLARLSEDTVFLSVPEGATAICVAREVGAFPIKTLTLDKGDRRPLGVGAGSLALYCAMDEARAHATCAINQNWLNEYGYNKKLLDEERAAFAKRGYALNKGRVIRGMSAVAVPVYATGGDLVAALAIGAIDERMTSKRIKSELAPALLKEAGLIAEQLPGVSG